MKSPGYGSTDQHQQHAPVSRERQPSIDRTALLQQQGSRSDAPQAPPLASSAASPLLPGAAAHHSSLVGTSLVGAAGHPQQQQHSTFVHPSPGMLEEYAVPLGGKGSIGRFSFGPDGETVDPERGRRRPNLPGATGGGGGTASAAASSGAGGTLKRFASYLIYAIVNLIIAVPGLYGYAAVIFNNPTFGPYMNALPKLVIFSSLIHQLGFALFSSLPFAIGTVQDAGLIFLSAMSNIVADEIIADGGTAEQAVSTALVILPMGTALLGLVLIAMGKFRLADAVSYLPMPVVGGYLAFIGYFCLLAGTALCISESMMDLKDWAYLLDPQNLLLAAPGWAAGLLLTWTSRRAKSDAALPLTMVAIPALFYVIIYATGAGMEGAREGGWVGKIMDPVPVSDLFGLIDYGLVRWDLAVKCAATWVGMVFVVSFASCLDVAAISMDMGEALDTNRELATVGVCNFMSGCLIGFTGSYIFSQTIFTYRTGCHSKWIGIFVMVGYLAVVVSTVNFLSVLPLFFLGSTLIFIGYDLLYEWLVEVRHKLLLTEYLVLVATFVAIHIIGIDFGILFGVVVAIVDYVVSTAQVSSLTRVVKRSRTVWKPEDWKLLQDHGYGRNPKIVTFELKGSVFFGSSVQLLQGISEDIGLDMDEEDRMELVMASPALHRRKKGDGAGHSVRLDQPPGLLIRPKPSYVVLDLSLMNNLDASAARGCFLQLAKMCAKRGIVVCATGANVRVDWILRSHDVAYASDEEGSVKAAFLDDDARELSCELDKILLFQTLYEGLEFAETLLIRRLTQKKVAKRPSFVRLDEIAQSVDEESSSAAKQPLSQIFSHILGLGGEERQLLGVLDGDGYGSPPFFEEVSYKEGDVVFRRDAASSSFFVVLKGVVAMVREEYTISQQGRKPTQLVSGAGPIRTGKNLSKAESIGEVRAILQVGTMFGFVDFLLERPRAFGAVATEDGVALARISRDRLDRLQSDSPEVYRIVQNVILQASVMELANCTCSE